MAYEFIQVYQSAETQDEATAADLITVLFPAGGRVEAWGTLQTEVGASTAPVESLDRITAAGVRTELLTLTPSTTAAVGVRTESTLRHVEFLPGERAVFEHKTAGAATGAFIAYVIVSHYGQLANSTTASPITRAAA